MPTKLTRPVIRETEIVDGDGRPLLVMLDAGGKRLSMKPKGTKQWDSLTYRQIWATFCVRGRMEEQRRRGK